MKRILKILASVAAGCVIGFVLGSLNSYRAISFFARSALAEMAIDVHELQQGRGDSVLERKRRALPRLVQQLESCHRKFLTETQWNSALWFVSRCYEGQECGPPASIKPILDALPPRPLPTCGLPAQRTGDDAKKTEAEQDKD